MATNPEIQICLKMLRDAFSPTQRGREVPAESDSVYALMLKDTPGDVLQAATLKIIASDTWYPAVARILESCKEVQLAAQPAHDWELGFSYCRKACRYFGEGQGKSACLEIAKYDQIAAATIERLGWDSFFFCDFDQETTFKAQFRNVYQTFVQREQQTLQLPAHVAEQVMRVSAALGKRALPAPTTERPHVDTRLIDLKG